MVSNKVLSEPFDSESNSGTGVPYDAISQPRRLASTAISAASHGATSERNGQVGTTTSSHPSGTRGASQNGHVGPERSSVFTDGSFRRQERAQKACRLERDGNRDKGCRNSPSKKMDTAVGSPDTSKAN